MRVAAVVPAAGKSSRMRGADKIFSLVLGKPLFVWSLEAMHRCPCIDDVILVVSADLVETAIYLCSEYGLSKVNRVVAGGDTRHDSVVAGLKCVSPDTHVVVVHDAARPLASPGLFSSVVRTAFHDGAVVAAIPCKDTVKHVEGDTVVRTISRSDLRLAQTPQAFRREFFNILTQPGDVTDEAALVEAAGGRVKIIQGEDENIKVTVPVDLVIVQTILLKRTGAE
ncbi:MAG: 2-C-methyl-D-erythritol 4-phosphate cytidylyltransferase [Bacillota bacterium]